MTEKQTVLEIHLGVKSADIKAVDLLADESDLSHGQIKRAMKNGSVWLERGGHVQRLRRADRKPVAGDVLHLYFNARIQEMKPSEASLIADEGDYSVWFKPAGMYSQGSKWGDHCSISRWAEQHLQPQRNAFIVHRLDRAASGLMLLAHGKKTAAQLSVLFRKRRVEKEYCVQVWGCFSAEPVCLNTDLERRSAVTHVRRAALDEVAGKSLLVVRIETGRKHQIRRHLAESGFPVVGDRLYGTKGDDGDLQLQAVRLSFACPLTGEHRRYELPEALQLSRACLPAAV
jgi:tRNA pseudouridine32 synthase/23S rRNA pseudouridine746 synthase